MFRFDSGSFVAAHGFQSHRMRPNPTNPAIRSTHPRGSTPLPGPEKNRWGLTNIEGTGRGRECRNAIATDVEPVAWPARSSNPPAATTKQTSARSRRGSMFWLTVARLAWDVEALAPRPSPAPTTRRKIRRRSTRCPTRLRGTPRPLEPQPDLLRGPPPSRWPRTREHRAFSIPFGMPSRIGSRAHLHCCETKNRIDRVARRLPLADSGCQGPSPSSGQSVVLARWTSIARSPMRVDQSVPLEPPEQWVDRAFAHDGETPLPQTLRHFVAVRRAFAHDRKQAQVEHSAQELGPAAAALSHAPHASRPLPCSARDQPAGRSRERWPVQPHSERGRIVMAGRPLTRACACYEAGNCTCCACARSEALSALRMYPPAIALSRLFVYWAM